MNTPTTGEIRPNSNQDTLTPKQIAGERLEHLSILIEGALGVVRMLHNDSIGGSFTSSTNTVHMALGAAEQLLAMCDQAEVGLWEALHDLEDKQP